MKIRWLSVGALFALTAVILGALLAHYLKEKVHLDSLNSFQTGVRYQMYHALLLIIISLSSYFSHKQKKILCYCISIGILLFSGSIYLLSLDELWCVSFSFLGPVTPIGGIFLIYSWTLMLVYSFKN